MSKSTRELALAGAEDALREAINRLTTELHARSAAAFTPEAKAEALADYRARLTVSRELHARAEAELKAVFGKDDKKRKK